MSTMVSEGVRLPNDLDAFPDQGFPPSLLVPFMGKWQVHHAAADQFTLFVQAAGEAGLPIVPIPGSSSAYRPLQQQINLFFQRYAKGGGASTKTYKGVVYHLLPHMAMAATPGTSMHGWGLAIDFMNANGSAITLAQRAKLRTVGAPLSVHDTVQSENWHFAVQNADIIMGTHYDAPAPEPHPTVEPAPVFGDGGGLIVKEGDTGNKVVFIQVAINKYASQNLDGDALGTFGGKTEAGVENTVKYVNASSHSTFRDDGEVDEGVWNMLRWITVANGGADYVDA